MLQILFLEYLPRVGAGSSKHAQNPLESFGSFIYVCVKI